MNERQTILISRGIGFFLSILLTGWIVFANTLPFGAHAIYSLAEKTIPPLGPASRVETVTENDAVVTKQKDDLIYFSTKFPFRFTEARVTVTFRNSTSSQEVHLGFQDKPEWHYSTQLLDSPLFYEPHWTHTGSGPVLFQWKPKYNSIEDFLSNLPTDAIIGTQDYTLKNFQSEGLDNYTPSKTESVINTPLRGKHTMYVYLKDEPFHLALQKQDLNWYNDADVLNIQIYKDDEMVLSGTVDDDGITDDSGRLGAVQEITLDNPGPGLPEEGIYRIVLDASSDTVIRGIQTNLHKIAFSGPIYPISNAEAYPGLVQKTEATTVFTNSNNITVRTYHIDAMQTGTFNNQPFVLNSTNTPVAINATGSLATLTLPKSDIQINGIGYYAFNKDQFFAPSSLKIMPVETEADTMVPDYIITPYSPPNITSENFFIAERTFDTTSAVATNGRLNWILQVPGLKENGEQLLIKNITVSYSKNGWWKK